MAISYLVQEEDGTSRLSLEDLAGFILLEETGAPTPTVESPQGGFVVSVRRPRRLIVPDDDELVALTLAARAFRRRRVK